MEESNFYHSHSMKTKPYLSLSLSLSLQVSMYSSVNKSFFLSRNDQGLFISFPICINSPREFLCSPWRVEVSSPLGLCHVILGRISRPCSPPKQLRSPWRANLCFCLFFPLLTSHGEQGASWWRANVPLCLFFSFDNSPWRVGCELKASKLVFLPIFGLVALCFLFSIFAQCLE